MSAEPAVRVCGGFVGGGRGGFVAWDVGGEEVDGTGWVGGCYGVGGEKSLGEVFDHSAGFGVEEGAGLRVAVEAQEF